MTEITIETVEKGDVLLSENENIIVGRVRDFNDDGTMRVEEVDEDIGEFSYNAPPQEVNENFDEIVKIK